MNILVWDNEPEGAQRIASAIAKWGHEPSVACTPEAALELLFLNTWDAVLLGPAVTEPARTAFREQVREMADLQRDLARINIVAIAGPGTACPGRAELPFGFSLQQLNASLHAEEAGPAAENEVYVTLPIFEPEGFESQCAGSPELMIEIVDLFSTECARQMTEMSGTLGSGDLNGLARVAHTLKGSLGSLHAPIAFRRAQALESAAKDQQTSECARLLAALVQDLAELDVELAGFREACLLTSAGQNPR